jgi:hypothetical protein
MQHNVYQFGAQIVLLPAITGIDRNVLPPEALLRRRTTIVIAAACRRRSAPARSAC